ncbi:hypothetical protein BT69DRAFT_1361240 [Atractiella rhizophila]|nr:hypothetical protein BT69DRAFT_1361240 [Atractiella rhizophila]
MYTLSSHYQKGGCIVHTHLRPLTNCPGAWENSIEAFTSGFDEGPGMLNRCRHVSEKGVNLQREQLSLLELLEVKKVCGKLTSWNEPLGATSGRMRLWVLNQKADMDKTQVVSKSDRPMKQIGHPNTFLVLQLSQTQTVKIFRVLDNVKKTNEQGLRILAIDNGGISTLSMLYMLEVVMLEVGNLLNVPEGEEVRPCDVFNLIAALPRGVDRLHARKVGYDCSTIRQTSSPKKLLSNEGYVYSAKTLEAVAQGIIMRQAPSSISSSQLPMKDAAIGDRGRTFVISSSFCCSIPHGGGIKWEERERTKDIAGQTTARMEVMGHKARDAAQCFVQVCSERIAIRRRLPLPPPGSCFGRKGEIHRVRKAILEGRHVVILGGAGKGNSTVALEAVHCEEIKQSFTDLTHGTGEDLCFWFRCDNFEHLCQAF